jgi:hypothetical protein
MHDFFKDNVVNDGQHHRRQQSPTQTDKGPVIFRFDIPADHVVNEKFFAETKIIK